MVKIWKDFCREHDPKFWKQACTLRYFQTYDSYKYKKKTDVVLIQPLASYDTIRRWIGVFDVSFKKLAVDTCDECDR